MRQSLLTAALLVLAWLLWMLRDLVILIGFAAVFAYALDPVVSWLERMNARPSMIATQRPESLRAAA